MVKELVKERASIPLHLTYTDLYLMNRTSWANDVDSMFITAGILDGSSSKHIKDQLHFHVSWKKHYCNGKIKTYDFDFYIMPEFHQRISKFLAGFGISLNVPIIYLITKIRKVDDGYKADNVMRSWLHRSENGDISFNIVADVTNEKSHRNDLLVFKSVLRNPSDLSNLNNMIMEFGQV